ncbi:MAG: exonuclease V [Candidatus Marsarchaeota archaeon]|nr:exonuclease V [Candidatus Marsarchaeota archaeon]
MDALKRLKKASIRASDIASQYWCEKQMELNYLYGQKITAEIRKGRQIHGALESETNIPIILMPKSYADSFYKGLFTSLMALKALKEKGKTREVQVYGSIDGFKIVGKIDQLEMKDGEVVIQEDKTRGSDNLPSEAQMLTHRVQVMLYRRLLEDIQSKKYAVDNFKKMFGASTLLLTGEFKRQLQSLEVENDMMSVNAVADKLFSEFQRMGRISNTLQIRYINQFTGKQTKLEKVEYTSSEMDGIAKFVMEYWKGGRNAMPVPMEEKWKCNFCAFFGKECKVWWPQKTIGNPSS